MNLKTDLNLNKQMKKPPLNKTDLDKATLSGCQMPGCKHKDHSTLFIHARCHPHGDIEVSYTLLSGELLIACRVCHTPIIAVAVADGPSEPDPASG